MRRARAGRPEDLSRFIVERLNAHDVDGLVALYEAGAVLALPDGGIATGSLEIRQAFERLLADPPTAHRDPATRTSSRSRVRATVVM